jgi:peptidoglycan hydrolase-like protein with peptidoglycan-binding domain
LTVAAIIAPLRQPSALAGTLFAALAAGIVVNALFLQPHQHPAPLVHTRVDDAGQSGGPQGRPDNLVLAIQTELSAAGYYGGPVDGIAGAQTQEAVSDFQSKAGLRVTGETTFELLSALRAASRSRVRQQEVAEREVNPSLDGQVAAVQDALARAAYGPVTADGVFGRETREAIERFQKDHGLPVTGTISDALVVELRAAGALDDE